MTGRITTGGHEIFALPPLLEWSVSYTGATPCDSFCIRFPYTPEVSAALETAAGVTLMDGENVALRGIVDEYEIGCSAAGRSATLSGRGYAARLLDNESRAAVYQRATLKEILRNHVEPYGIACDEVAEIASGAEPYTVAAGSSQWRAVEEFCRAYGGFTPRFDRYGRLHAAKESGGNVFSLKEETKLLSLVKRERRYGVLSEVLVIDKTRGTMQSVKNEAFIRRGGQCRRVLYTPGQSSWSAMRYTGAYQIERSGETAACIEATLPGNLAVFPGDTVVLARRELGIAGTYRVAETVIRGGEGGKTTALTLREKKKDRGGA